MKTSVCFLFLHDIVQRLEVSHVFFHCGAVEHSSHYNTRLYQLCVILLLLRSFLFMKHLFLFCFSMGTHNSTYNSTHSPAHNTCDS